MGGGQGDAGSRVSWAGGGREGGDGTASAEEEAAEEAAEEAGRARGARGGRDDAGSEGEGAGRARGGGQRCHHRHGRLHERGVWLGQEGSRGRRQQLGSAAKGLTRQAIPIQSHTGWFDEAHDDKPDNNQKRDSQASATDCSRKSLAHSAAAAQSGCRFASGRARYRIR